MIRISSDQAVVLLHGLGANRLAMLRLSMALGANGYQVANWGYPSTRSSIEVQARKFQQRLHGFLKHNHFAAVHLVAHSMGGVVARRAFSESRPENFGRFVMLSPPNAGSHVARRLARPFSRLCPPLLELSDAPDSYVNQLDPPIGLDLGVIAAAYDRVVALPSTHLPCQADHIVLRAHHGTLPWRRETIRQVLHFLQHGRFLRDAFPPAAASKP